MENLNSDLAKLATTASVLVNSATTNTNINDMIQKNMAFKSTFDPKGDGKSGVASGKSNGLLGLLAKHNDNVRVARSLKRSNFTGEGKKKKDFNVLSNDMLNDIRDRDPAGSGIHSSTPGEESRFSLFQGFAAVLPEVDDTILSIRAMSGKLLEDSGGKRKQKGRGKDKTPLVATRLKKIEEITSEKIKTCQNQRVLLNFISDINYHLDLLEIRKGLGKSEVDEIDAKIDRLYLRRKEISDNVAYYEETENDLENHLLEIKERLEFIKDIDVPEYDELDENNEVNPDGESNGTNNNMAKLKNKKNKNRSNGSVKDKRDTAGSSLERGETKDTNAEDSGDAYDNDYVNVYMEEDSKSYSRVTSTTKSFKAGDQIHKFQAHHDPITCLAFDEPYGRLLTCSLDNTVRLWDMNRYKCIGLLEGHYASVNCVDIFNNLAFTGSMDASVKVWDLDCFGNNKDDETPLLYSFEGHVDSVTALSYNNGELVSGSNDKTIRQWDLNTGHLVQTIDVMWASSMANSSIHFGDDTKNMRPSAAGNLMNNSSNYPYISSLQVFDAALASGSNDGIVRLWDLRSGEVIRQLLGHTGAITTLQFDKNFNLVTGSSDRSVRIWDLRTGGLLDSFSYDNAIKKLMFDEMKIVSAVENERGLHVYDRSEQRHWMLGGDLLEDGAPDTATLNCSNDMQFRGSYLVEGRSDGVVSVWNV